jgi:hypothetical protein
MGRPDTINNTLLLQIDTLDFAAKVHLSALILGFSPDACHRHSLPKIL